MKRWELYIEQVAKKFPHIWFSGSIMKWIMLGGAVGVLSGSASALFLYSLEWVTEVRLEHAWLLFLLPFGGVLVSYLYMKYGLNSSKGNNLILETVQGGNDSIPLRMAPLVLLGTLTTHLFGGSAGREGTAVQMGGSLAEWFGRIIKINANDRVILLMCGISGGFGSVFGTPVAGAIFGLEVVALGLISHRALIPCFTASFVGNLVATEVWGAGHVHYSAGSIPDLTGMILLKVIIASILFGLTALCFSELTHYLKKLYARLFPNLMLRSAVGGFLVIGLVYITGSRAYLGLGLPLIEQSFNGNEGGELSPWAFLWKLLFTSTTLGAGFQGGEVTPLFAIGSTLGHSLAGILELYGPFLASLGFIAVFSGAANTPIACFVMGIELFGAEGALYMFIACIVSYVFSGHSGIYTSQQIGTPKSGRLHAAAGMTLGKWKERNHRDS